jgi:hypothetical protein
MMRGLPVELLPMGENAVIWIPLSLPDQVRDVRDGLAFVQWMKVEAYSTRTGPFG